MDHWGGDAQMIGRMWAMILALLLLGGCGRGSEDFTVRIARPADRVMEVLGHAELDGLIASHFPGLKIERSQPASNEVLYTVPGDGRFPAAIHLTFEAASDGNETVVHAAVDVPPVNVELDGKAKVISETKVERVLKDLIESVRTKIESGGDTAGPQKDLSQLLSTLAIVTDSRQLKLAKNMERNPDWYMRDFNTLYDGEDEEDRGQRDGPAPAYGNPAIGDDPGAVARQQQYNEKERAEDASAPMDQTRGEDTRGDGTSGED